MKLFLLLAILAISQCGNCKIFTRCELAKTLSLTFPRDKLADWNCLVKHESAYNSKAKGPQNKNKSFDWGIFQINDKYWCTVGTPGGDCHVDCLKLLDDDITDDVRCAQKIFKRHGFAAWYGWKNNCNGRPIESVDDCFVAKT